MLKIFENLYFDDEINYVQMAYDKNLKQYKCVICMSNNEDVTYFFSDTKYTPRTMFKMLCGKIKLNDKFLIANDAIVNLENASKLEIKPSNSIVNRAHFCLHFENGKIFKTKSFYLSHITTKKSLQDLSFMITTAQKSHKTAIAKRIIGKNLERYQ